MEALWRWFLVLSSVGSWIQKQYDGSSGGNWPSSTDQMRRSVNGPRSSCRAIHCGIFQESRTSCSKEPCGSENILAFVCVKTSAGETHNRSRYISTGVKEKGHWHERALYPIAPATVLSKEFWLQAWRFSAGR